MPFHAPAWDLELLILINQHGRNAFLDWIMPLFSSSVLLWLIGAISMIPALIRRKDNQIVQIICLVLAISLADAGSNILKNTFDRVRPYKAVVGTYSLSKGDWERTPTLTQDEKMASGTSYPSAHAANTMALTVLVMAFWPQTRPWLLLIPALVGYSRIYLGKHYPLDVAAGWIWGAVAALIIYLAWMQWNIWFRQRTYRQDNTTST